jgi:oxygen-independent coproporphyrinogen III oxidase
VARLHREIERVGPLFRNRTVQQIHFGGGTPNFLSPQQLGDIVNALHREFESAADEAREISIEIDPRVLLANDLQQLADLGFNRVSLGVQDFDASVQAAVNRIQPIEQTINAVGDCRQAGIHSINVDLMYGLPRQTVAGFRQTLQSIAEMRPSRIALYGYAHMPRLFKAQRRIDDRDLPAPATRVALLAMAIEVLTAAGYRHIGMDHFALPQDPLVIAQESGTLHRNFMGYSTQAGCDLLGLGVSAISHIGNSFSQNQRDLQAWEAAIDAGKLPVWRGIALAEDDVVRADVITRIMCQGDVDVPTIEQQYGIDFWSYFAQARELLRELEADGLVWVCSTHIIASPRGRYFLRLIAGCFDRYLNSESPQRQAAAGFSKVV